jgi:hypothetical protein
MDDDPFSDANSRPAAEARALLARAEKEFADKHFAAAGRLYEQACRTDPNALAGCREQWAYCKLFGVAQALNHPEDNAPSSPELEKEVRQALSMAPKLEGFGKDLLNKIQDRGAGPARVEVRHTPRQQGQGWAVAETANFRILHNQSRDFAERVARTAEETRAAMARKWFGAVPPTWGPRCDIYLHAGTEEYVRGSPAPPPPRESPGHTTMSFEGGRVVGRRIDLRCNEPHLVDAVLPHETTHVVVGERFIKPALPKWADEGMAVLTEPQERINLHLHNLPMHRRDGHLFGVGQLLQMENYPHPRYIGPFYAQSVSLVDFLARQKGPQVFTKFVRDGLDGGYEAALRRHYDFQGFQDLEQRWRQYAFGAGATPSTVAEKRR